MARQGPVHEANAIIMFNKTNKHMYSYKPLTKELSQMQEFPSVNKYSFSTTVVSGKHIYILREKEVNQLEYSDSTAKWKQVSGMSEYHGIQPPAAVLNGSIYVCGRSGISGSTNSVERYDADSDRWHRVCDMNNGRYKPCVVGTKDHIYCMGGLDERMHSLKSVERFDAKLNKCEFVKSLPRLTCLASAVVVKNRIYVANFDEGVLYYDTQNDSWTEIKLSNQWPFVDNPEKYCYLKILAVNEELYIIGECLKKKIFSKKTTVRIYMFEPETNQLTLAKKINDKSDYNVAASLAVKL